VQWSDQGRARSFGSVAEDYDRFRPTYPAALIDDLVGGGTPVVLDIGCGTGKASELFAARGCRVLGVEPDARMAGVARRKGIEVEVSPFESWEIGGRRFDLAVSAQAWHWMDPDAAPVKAADALAPGGRLALFWNIGRHDPEVRAALKTAYDREAPSLADHTTALGILPDEGEGRVDQLMRSGCFEAPEVRSYPWDATYSRDAWLDYIGTVSDHLRLPAEQREALLRALATVIDGLGGSLTFHFTCALVLATRRQRVLLRDR
jgi:SAM-dependent methyltransferase